MCSSDLAEEIGEDDDISEIEVEEFIPPQPEVKPVVEPAYEQVAEPIAEAPRGGSNTIPVLFGILGMAVGGFGAWMANDASGKIADLERQLQTLTVTGSSSQDNNISDLQQRLGKIERRLTGTPTIEAAAPLSTSSTPAVVEAPVKPAVVKPVAITPKTPAGSASATSAAWVVNL